MVTIRSFQAEDTFPVIKIAHECLPESYHPSIFNYFYETYPQGFLVAEYLHSMVGFIVGVPYGIGQGKILMLAIKEPQRRKGIGSALLHQLINVMKTSSTIQTIDLEVRTTNTAAIHFYQNHGFAIVETIEKFYQTGTDAYRMVRRSL